MSHLGSVAVEGGSTNSITCPHIDSHTSSDYVCGSDGHTYYSECYYCKHVALMSKGMKTSNATSKHVQISKGMLLLQELCLKEERCSRYIHRQCFYNKHILSQTSKGINTSSAATVSM